jgi:hypothetical protein
MSRDEIITTIGKAAPALTAGGGGEACCLRIARLRRCSPAVALPEMAQFGTEGSLLPGVKTASRRDVPQSQFSRRPAIFVGASATKLDRRKLDHLMGGLSF